MKVTRLSLCLVALLVSAHRLPAPIQEISESPTLAREQKPKPRKIQSKTKVIASEPATKSTPRSSTAVLQGPARFAGTWTGTINQGVLGNVAISLVINAPGTSVQEISRVGTFTRTATIGGNMMTWRAGWLSEIAWTFTPNNDGKTAAVTSNSAFGVNGSATFQRQ